MVSKYARYKRKLSISYAEAMKSIARFERQNSKTSIKEYEDKKIFLFRTTEEIYVLVNLNFI